MSYQHILVAVDLSNDSDYLVKRAVELAKPLNAELSFIHIDVSYAEVYTGLIDINLAETQNQTMKSSQQHLQKMADKAQYPVKHTLVGSGDLGNELCDTITEFNIDLLVCGHHQDFWSKFISSTKQLINCSPVDMLVVPLKD